MWADVVVQPDHPYGHGPHAMSKCTSTMQDNQAIHLPDGTNA